MHSKIFQDHIRTIRRELIAIEEASEYVDLPRESLKRMLDSWDDFEYSAGTAEGCENEVTS